MPTASARYWRRRLARHALLAATAFALVACAYALTPPPDVRHRASMASAYAGLFFLAGSLWLGPWNVLRRKPNPVSSDLRRDVGIWAGALALLHTAVGLTVHLRGRMWMYFFKGLHPLRLQNTSFGMANYTGLFAALVFVMLVAISNDLSLRQLGVSRWKYWQRWAYVAFGLTVVHGILYQVIEKRRLPWLLVSGAVVVSALAIQGMGEYCGAGGLMCPEPAYFERSFELSGADASGLLTAIYEKLACGFT